VTAARSVIRSYGISLAILGLAGLVYMNKRSHPNESRDAVYERVLSFRGRMVPFVTGIDLGSGNRDTVYIKSREVPRILFLYSSECSACREQERCWLRLVDSVSGGEPGNVIALTMERGPDTTFLAHPQLTRPADVAGSEFLNRLGGLVVPTSLVVDRTGVIELVVPGVMTADLERAVLRAYRELL